MNARKFLQTIEQNLSANPQSKLDYSELMMWRNALAELGYEYTPSEMVDAVELIEWARALLRGSA
jgi:hypothetical protein